jgi:hypothetical protein
VIAAGRECHFGERQIACTPAEIGDTDEQWDNRGRENDAERTFGDLRV